MSSSTSSSAREAVVDHTKALALVTTLRSISATMKDNSVKKLQAQLGDPGGANRSLDRSGAQIQHEALQVAMLMHGLRGCSEKSVIGNTDLKAACKPTSRRSWGARSCWRKS